MMQIYSFNNWEFRLMNIIYAIGAMALLVALLFAIREFVRQIIAYKKSKLKLPVMLVLLFAVLMLVPLAGSIGFGSLFFKSARYAADMRAGASEYVTSDVVLLSCEEDFYRDSFLGYKVELEIDGEVIAPSNTFSAEVVRVFESDQKLTIQYGIIEHEGLYIWSIKTEE